jgi:hypothetical protein
VLARDRADQQHGVQVHVRVEEREREAGQDRRAQGGRRRAGRDRLRLPGERPPGSQRRVAEQEGRAAPAGHGHHGRVGRRGRAEAADAERDQQRVGDHAGRHDRPDVLTPDALAQDEGVLRPDRGDQGQGGAEPGDGGGDHAPKVRSPTSVPPLMFFSSD